MTKKKGENKKMLAKISRERLNFILLFLFIFYIFFAIVIRVVARQLVVFDWKIFDDYIYPVGCGNNKKKKCR